MTRPTNILISFVVVALLLLGAKLLLFADEDEQALVPAHPSEEAQSPPEAPHRATIASTATTDDVKSSEEVEANLEIVEGAITLSVKVKGENKATIDAAQVFLFVGKVDASKGADVTKLFIGASTNAKMGFALGGAEAKFEKVVPGSYSLCILPIAGNISDPSIAAKIQRHADTLDVYCKAAQVTAAPSEQSITTKVPPMTPFSDDE